MYSFFNKAAAMKAGVLEKFFFEESYLQHRWANIAANTECMFYFNLALVKNILEPHEKKYLR